MGKKTKIIVAAVIGVLLLSAAAFAGPIIYRDLIAAPAAEAPAIAEPAPSAPRQEASSETPSSPIDELTGEWKVTEGSFAGYRVNEVLNGTEVTVTGRTPQVAGLLVFDGGTLVSAEFEVDVASISTDSPQRDRHFTGTAMRAQVHPVATFVLSEPLMISEEQASGSVGEHTITGHLTLAGVTNQVTFQAEARADGSAVQIAGQIPITFADYGVTAPNLGFVAVEPSGFVEFLIIADR